jgi:hypothetical protein
MANPGRNRTRVKAGDVLRAAAHRAPDTFTVPRIETILFASGRELASHGS